jgi:hypothetical protein
MHAEGVKDILDLETWFFVEESASAPPDCGEDGGGPPALPGCGGALNMLCARHLAGPARLEDWWGFEACMMADQSAIPGNAAACAAAHGIDETSLRACVNGAEGAQLVRRSAGFTKTNGVGWTPWFILEGTMQMPSQDDYLGMICDAYAKKGGSPAPAGCPSTKRPRLSLRGAASMLWTAVVG